MEMVRMIQLRRRRALLRRGEVVMVMVVMMEVVVVMVKMIQVRRALPRRGEPAREVVHCSNHPPVGRRPSYRDEPQIIPRISNYELGLFQRVEE